MMSTARTRREDAERRASRVAVVGAGYTFDITKEAAAAGIAMGVLRHDASGFYYVNEPYGYYDALELPRVPSHT